MFVPHQKQTLMKLLHKLMVGVLLLGAAQLAAQSGATLTNGINPKEQSSLALRQGNPPVPLDGNGNLGPAYQASDCGLNYTTATQKLGQRFSPLGVPQPATFTISGVPSTATILQAFIWCDASGNGAPITLNVVNPLATSFTVPMVLVGTDADKCWGYAGSTTYRADITGTIPATSPNGSYSISGFPVDPGAATHTNDVDGATMIVIWRDPTANFQGDLIIWDGAMVGLGVPTSNTMVGFSACNGNVHHARAFMGIGDLQGFNSQLTLNGVTGITTVPEDWWNFVDVATTVTPGQSSSVFGNSVQNDCYNIALEGLYFQSDCKTCDFPCDPKPEFTWNGCNPVMFDGRNDGVSPVVSWFWQFGDGQTSTLEDPTHSYTTPGVYTVCLTIISISSKGETCCNQVCHEIEVCPPPPCSVQPEFHWYSTPNNPMLVYLSDATVYAGGSICNYTVDFGDGSPVYTGPVMPSFHTYPAPGSYEMCMKVTVCVYDADGNVISKCEEKVCHKIVVGPEANSGRIGQNNAAQTSSDISVFPNPTNAQINVTVNANAPVVVRILNANGQEVAVAKAVGKNVYQADLSNFAAGIYFVTVQSADGSVKKEMFVKE
jgi:hypothetical protein